VEPGFDYVGYGGDLKVSVDVIISNQKDFRLNSLDASWVGGLCILTFYCRKHGRTTRLQKYVHKMYHVEKTIIVG
jgi:hypothetical protein